jgi:hypothetical protein
MKTKPRSTSAHNIGEFVTKFWRELLANNEVKINSDDGAQGGVVLSDGKPQWWAHDKNGNDVDPVERSRTCGSHRITYNWFRGQKPAAKRELRFGPPSPPQRDGFFTGQPSHPLSIMARPWFGIELADRRQIGCVANGFPFAAEGHLLALIGKFTDGDIAYPWIAQSLNSETVKLILDLALALGDAYAVGFNPPYGGASQEQFHGHVVKTGEYPVERAVRVPLAGGCSFPLYPAGCLILENAFAQTISAWVGRLRAYGIVSNLLVRGRTAYVFPRRPGVGIVPDFPAGLIAFSELSGHWICSDESVYEAIDEDSLRTALRRTTLPVDEAWSIAMG